MVLGGATQKIQTIVELAEDQYEKVTELREELMETQASVEDIQTRIRGMETELDEQRELLEAIANAHDISSDDVFEPEEDALSGTDP